MPKHYTIPNISPITLFSVLKIFVFIIFILLSTSSNFIVSQKGLSERKVYAKRLRGLCSRCANNVSQNCDCEEKKFCLQPSLKLLSFCFCFFFFCSAMRCYRFCISFCYLFWFLFCFVEIFFCNFP